MLLRILALGLIASVRTYSNAAASELTTSDGTLIDHVWAGHPVGFALLVERGHVFIGYYDAERRLTVAARPAGRREWTRVQLEGIWNEAKQRWSNVVGWDSHNSIVLAVDADGYLHLSGNLHVDPLVYYRSRRPLDITSFERLDRMTGDREARATYPHFFKDAAGELYFDYRDGSSGDAVDLYNRYDRATRQWQRHIPTPLFDGEGRRSAYALPPTLGPDGRFHLLWMWRDNPDAATNQQLSYARSRDLLQWEDAQGNPVPLPITFGGGDVIDDARPGEGLVNTTYALGFAPDGQPVAVYHRYNSEGHSQLFAARPAGADWQRQPLTDWRFRWAFGGYGSLQVDVYIHPVRTEADGTLLVPFFTREVPSGVLRVNPQTLKAETVLPPDAPVLPATQMQVRSPFPEMEVRTRAVETEEGNYILRWETLPSNRDQPRPTAPPPSELRLIEQRAVAAPDPPS